MNKSPKRIKDYQKEIHDANQHYVINGNNIENGVNIYEDTDGRPFFNLLSTRVFPIELAPHSYAVYRTNGNETLQNIAWIYYSATRLWWVIAEANHITNPFEVFKPGILIKVPNESMIPDILQEMRK